MTSGNPPTQAGSPIFTMDHSALEPFPNSTYLAMNLHSELLLGAAGTY